MDFKALEKFTTEYSDKTGFSGYLRLTLKDEVIYSASIGTEEFNEKSMFTLYSLSKPFCALGIMKLYDKDLLDIDHHPSKYLPQTSVLDKSLTIRHLMQHTSGIPDFYLEGGVFSTIKGDRKGILENLGTLFAKPMYFMPGSEAKYSNINYTLMALIIENVSGLDYAEFMRKEIFDPLSMPYAAVDSYGLEIENRVIGKEKKDGKTITECDRNLNWILGAGDIIGCALDVYRLNIAVKNKLLISENSWKQVLSPSPLNHMGFGCTVKNYDGRTRITHNGGHTGFRTYHIHILQDDFDVILLSNSGWGIGRSDIETQIYNLFYGYDITAGVITPMDTGYI